MEPRNLPVVAALAALSATVALAFGQVFESGRYVAPVLAAALLPHAIALIARWRRAKDVVVWASSLGTLTVYTVFVLPGTGSPGALFDRLGDGWRVIERDPVPLRATNGTVLLAVIVVWLVSTFADDLAVERHASLGAVAPGVVVLIWVMALGTEDGQWLTVGIFGCAAALFLAVQHQMLLEERRTRIGTRRLLEAPGLLAAGAVIGVVAIVLGIAAAPALPGGDEPLIDTDGLGHNGADDSYTTKVAPFLDIRKKLTNQKEQKLFTVEAEDEQYWRLVALDTYSSEFGGQWTLEAKGEDQVNKGLDGSDRPGALVQRVRIGKRLGEKWIPAAFEPVQVSVDDVLVVTSSSTLVAADPVAGLAYTVVSVPPPVDLTTDQIAATDREVPDELLQYTDLPADFPQELRDIAVETAAGATTPYGRALALRDFFRDESFVYNPDASPADSGSALLDFVTVTKTGFCVQFASAFATMARALGIPARVAVGFTSGVEQNGVFTVTNHDAHAWPEIWLAGIGWAHPFDPTPPSEAPGGSNLPDEPPVPPPAVTTTTATTLVPSSTLVPSTVPSPQPQPTPGGGGVTIDRTASDAGDDGSGLAWIVLIVLGVLALLAAPVAAVLWLKSRRRARRRDHPDAASAVSGAWAEAVDELTDRRMVWPPSDTPRELATRVPLVAGPETAAPMRALAESYGAVRYGRTRPPTSAVDDAWSQVDALKRALDASSSFTARLRARLDPGTLRRRDRHLVRPGASHTPGEPD